MTSQVEFSSFYKLLFAIKEGDESKKDSLNLILTEYKEGKNADSFLKELGQIFLYIGVDELFKYTNSIDLKLIGQLSKEEWEGLAEKNKGELPVHLANTMIFYANDKERLKTFSSKWQISKREVEKHIMPMARYISEGLIDVLD